MPPKHLQIISYLKRKRKYLCITYLILLAVLAAFQIYSFFLDKFHSYSFKFFTNYPIELQVNMFKWTAQSACKSSTFADIIGKSAQNIDQCKQIVEKINNTSVLAAPRKLNDLSLNIKSLGFMYFNAQSVMYGTIATFISSIISLLACLYSIFLVAKFIKQPIIARAKLLITSAIVISVLSDIFQPVLYATITGSISHPILDVDGVSAISAEMLNTLSTGYIFFTVIQVLAAILKIILYVLITKLPTIEDTYHLLNKVHNLERDGGSYALRNKFSDYSFEELILAASKPTPNFKKKNLKKFLWSQ